MSKDNKEKKSILQKELNTKEILAVLGVAGAIAAYAFVFIYPKYTDFKLANDNLSNIESQIKEYEDRINEMPNLQSKLDSLTSELNVKSRKLAHNMEDGMFLIGLSKIMDNYSVDLVSYSVDEVIPYETFYAIPTTIEVRGDYRNVREIMYYMESQKNMTQILDYSMENYIEEKETSNDTSIAQNKLIDNVVYWTDATSTDYHKEYCGILQNEVAEGGKLSSGAYIGSGKVGPCEVCKPYTVSTHPEVEVKPSATGEVMATFKFVMYSADSPTLDLNNDDASKWGPGKWNPFKTTSR